MGKAKDTLKNAAEFDKVAKKVFSDADSDKSGTITLDELEQLILHIACECGTSSPPHSEVVDIMNQLDANQDGKVNFQEFVPLARQILSILGNKGY